MKINKIKPIPKYILRQIIKREKQTTYNNRYIRFYSYLSKNDGELVKIIVACKNDIYGKRWRCKQVVIHGVHSNQCFLKDIKFSNLGGYSVGWFDEGLQQYPRWYEDKEWGYQKDKYFNIDCPVLNVEYALRFEEYRYSAIDKYLYNNTLKYLRLYEKYPQTEMLVKLGLSDYATSIQLLKKIGKDKCFRKWIARKRNEISLRHYYIRTLLVGYKTGKDLKQVQKQEIDKKIFYNKDGYANVKKLFTTEKEIITFMEYISNQNTSISSYSDYLTACEYLGLDMTLSKNIYPHDFKRWHDIRIDEYHSAKALKDQEERKELYDKFVNVATKYLRLEHNKKSTYIAIIAKKPLDLIFEGEALDHCVGRMNYDQKFIREESLIFFIRLKSAPETPLVTVEYSLSKKKVLQCYGYQDSKPNEDILTFVNKKWLPYANKQLKQIVA